MKALLAAIQFLTIFPVPQNWADGKNDLKNSAIYFPIVGLLIGGLIWAFALAARNLFPELLFCVVVVIVLIGVSGGLHIDGLADTMDGFLSSRPRDKVLEIMRDSRVGVMGVLGITGIILLKVSALAATADDLRMGTIFLMPLAGRCALVITMSVLTYVRGGEGLVGIFSEKRRNSVMGVILAIAIFSLFAGIVGGLMGLVAMLASLAVTIIFCAYAYNKIGGYTGDILGAVCEIVELVPALVAAAWSYRGF